MNNNPASNSNLDLNFERIVDVPREMVWKAWTTPELLKKWFTPAPWQTVDAQIDLRPGGLFRTVMRSPEGQEFPNEGCFLEVIPNERLTWTNALAANFRPAKIISDETCGGFPFTAIIRLAPHASGTKYTATVLHLDEKGAKAHAAMGFEEGWGKALEQMVAMIKKM